MDQDERFDDVSNGSASFWEVRDPRVLDLSMVHPSEVPIIGNEDSSSCNGMLEICRVGRTPQSGFIGCQHINTALSKLDRDCCVNVFIKLKPDIRHGVAGAVRGVGLGAAA